MILGLIQVQDISTDSVVGAITHWDVFSTDSVTYNLGTWFELATPDSFCSQQKEKQIF